MIRNPGCWLLGLVLTAGTACGQVATPQRGPQSPDQDRQTARTTRAVAHGINQLGAGIYQRLPLEGPENVCFSPLGLALGLGVARAGARGETAAEFDRLLQVQQASEFEAGCREIVQRFRPLKPPEASQVRLQVSLWCQEGDPFSEAFKAATRTQFQAHTAPLDFKADPEAARNTINAWLHEATSSRLPDLLPPGSLDERNRLLIATVVDFSATWQLRFEKSKTKPADFHRSDEEKISVPMMHNMSRYSYSSTADVHLLGLPFENDLAMLLLIPHAVGGLKHAEALLTGGGWEKLAGESRDQLVSLDLPRFKIQPRTADFAPIVQNLGCRRAFTPEADFSAIRTPPDRELSLRSLRHACWLDVDENGTRAVASTSLEIGVKGQPEVVVRADRPFVFLVRDQRTGVLLFTGRCLQPGSAEEGAPENAKP